MFPTFRSVAIWFNEGMLAPEGSLVEHFGSSFGTTSIAKSQVSASHQFPVCQARFRSTDDWFPELKFDIAPQILSSRDTGHHRHAYARLLYDPFLAN